MKLHPRKAGDISSPYSRFLPLCIVWMVLAPLSVFLTLNRHRLQQWFPLHVILSLCIYLTTIFAIVPGFTHSKGKHLNNTHRVLGFLLFIFLYFTSNRWSIYLHYLYIHAI